MASAGAVLMPGLGLILANGISTGALHDVWTSVSDTKANIDIKQEHQNMILIGGEFVFVFVLAWFAEQSDEAGSLILALIMVLWLVWITFNIGTVQRWVAKSQPAKKS